MKKLDKNKNKKIEQIAQFGRRTSINHHLFGNKKKTQLIKPNLRRLLKNYSFFNVFWFKGGREVFFIFFSFLNGCFYKSTTSSLVYCVSLKVRRTEDRCRPSTNVSYKKEIHIIQVKLTVMFGFHSMHIHIHIHTFLLYIINKNKTQGGIWHAAVN